MVPRQSQSYAGLCTFKIAWLPLGSTLGDNDPLSTSNTIEEGVTNVINYLIQRIYVQSQNTIQS